jgi:UDP-glucose 4-epimerase
MHVLLTGSSGWLGRFLAPRLVQQGHRVTGLDIAPGQHTDFIGSIHDRALIHQLFADHHFNAVIHAAALHKPDIARYARQDFVDVNIAGTLNLLEASVQFAVSRFVFTSTTSLMITQAIRDEISDAAIWLDETSAPLAPRNIYGVTKRAAEEMCRLVHQESGLAVIILRTARFFPEEDDTHRPLSGENMKANEFLHRRLTVEDCADAHIAALGKAADIGFGIYIVSAPPPFGREACVALKSDPAVIIAKAHPDVSALYTARGWSLPRSIGRVYDPSALERDLGFRCQTDFGAVLQALRIGAPLPFTHDATYVSPKEQS